MLITLPGIIRGENAQDIFSEGAASVVAVLALNGRGNVPEPR